MRTLAAEVKAYVGKTVTIAGWLHKKRALGALMFVLVRDRTGIVQVVVEDVAEQEKLTGMQIGTVLTIAGKVKAEPRAQIGAEIHSPKITVEVPVEEAPPIEIDKPIDHKSENYDTLFENRALNLRNPTEGNIFKVAGAVSNGIRWFLSEQGFIEIRTPKILAEATEGGAEVFKLEYFDRGLATLAQSPQFYKQMLVGAYERVYEIAPAYRAEPSLTTRHMSEFTSVDLEMGFITDYAEAEDLLGEMLHFVVEMIWKHNESELKSLDAKKPKLTKKIPKVKMSEIHERYTKATGEDTTREKDLSPAEERFICQYAEKQLGSEAIFVTDWPAASMKFYHKKNPNDPNLAIRSDLLFRGTEIATGSQRENHYGVLLNQLRGMGGDPNHPGYKYYLQAFKYGLPTHAGFGLGLERLIQKLVGLNSVKEATLFPRDMQRLVP